MRSPSGLFWEKRTLSLFLEIFFNFFLPAFFFSKLNSQRNSLPKPCITYPLIESFQVHFLLGLCKLLPVILALDFELIADKWGTEVAIAWHFNDGHLRIEKGLSNPSCTPHCSPCTFTASNTSYTGITTDSSIPLVAQKFWQPQGGSWAAQGYLVTDTHPECPRNQGHCRVLGGFTCNLLFLMKIPQPRGKTALPLRDSSFWHWTDTLLIWPWGH